MVLPNGVLFRGGAEAKNRETIVRNDLIEAVIAMPKNLFFGPAIPVCVIIFNKNKEEKRRGEGSVH